MNKLNHMLSLLRESLSEANFYAKEVTVSKRRKTRRKQVANVKKRKKKKKAPDKKDLIPRHALSDIPLLPRSNHLVSECSLQYPKYCAFNIIIIYFAHNIKITYITYG